MPGPRSRGPHAADLQRLAGRQRDRGAGALRAHRPARRAARPLPRHADPAGQRALEAAGDEGDRLPPGLVVRRLPRAGGDAHLLDLAARDDRRRRARSSTCAARTCGRSRRRERSQFHAPEDWLAPARSGGPGGRGARHRAGRRQAGRRLVPPRPHLARLGAEHERDRGADGARHAHAAGRGALPRDERRPDLLALPPPRRPLARRVVLPGAVGRDGYRTPWLAELPAID